jgi:hypothetical protein
VKLYRRNGHRPEYFHQPWGRPLPPVRVDPPPTQSRPRLARRRSGYRTPLGIPLGVPPTPRGAQDPGLHPLARRDPDQGRVTDLDMRARRRADKAAERRSHPRPTRRGALAEVRAMFPDERITRHDEVTAAHYELTMTAWRQRTGRA